MDLIVKFLPAFGLLALAYVFIKSSWVSKQDVGNEKMARIAKNIADGAMSFLKAEYKILAVFVAAVAVLLFIHGIQSFFVHDITVSHLSIDEMFKATILLTLSLTKYSQASPTAQAVLPVPAGPVQKVISDSTIALI